LVIAFLVERFRVGVIGEGVSTVALKHSSEDNQVHKVTETPEISDLDDMSLVDPPGQGQKGGQIQKDAREDDTQPASLVDYLWKHHDD